MREKGTKRADRLAAREESGIFDRMNSPFSPTPAPQEHNVTASELVRHFGVWQERAARAPVYVLHRGRPRLVLTSVDLMDALCAPRGGPERERDRLSGLLDATREIVLFCDADGRLVPASRTARAVFGPDVALSAAALAAVGGAFLSAALDRVLASGIAESIEFAPASHRDRLWSAEIAPTPDGALVLCRDVSAEAEASRRRAEAMALDDALAALGGVATARLTLRGHIDGDTRSLAALTGIDAAALASVRLPVLFDVGSRVRVGEAMDAVLSNGVARAVPANLLINRGQPLPVRIAISAVRAAAAIEGGLALLARDHG